MQPYDIIMLAMLVTSTLFGFIKGVAWQVASLASLAASYFVALKFGDTLAPYISASAPWNKFVAMLVLYLATSLVIWVVFRRVSQFIDRVRLREFDRQLGALVGAGKGALYCVAITFFAVTLSADARAAVLKSRSGHYIALAIHRAKPVMPKELDESLGPYLDQLEGELKPAASTAPATPEAAAPAGSQEIENSYSKPRPRAS
jgi:membrane protein required for colicin V production